MSREPDLMLLATDRGDDAVFDRFYQGYDRAFILPDEKESRDGLLACLALNHGPAHAALVARYGAFQELCLVAQAPGGRFIGGANLFAVAPAPGQRLVTANLNYIYVDAAARGRGHLRQLLRQIAALVARLFPAAEASGALLFIEQNDPLLMSDEAYARDSRFTGLDQIDRLRIWARQGAKVVDFPYVQPPLSAGQAADATLVYSVLGADGDRLPASLLAHHLRGFFGVSVLKGAALADHPVARAQLELLAAGASVPLLDPTPALAALAAGTPAPSAGTAFRDWARRCQPSSPICL
jgi:hypothetical protein